MAEDKEPIRRWTFHAIRTGKGPSKDLKVNVFGTQADADKMNAFLQRRYQEFVDTHPGMAGNIVMEARACEEVSEETKIAYDSVVREAATGVEALRIVIGQVFNEADDTADKKQQAFEMLMRQGEDEVEEADLHTVMWEMGRRRVANPIVQKVLDAVKKATGRSSLEDVEVHVIPVGKDTNLSGTVVELRDYKDKNKQN